MNQQLREVRTGGGVDATFVLGSSLTVKDLYIASRNTSDDVAINVLDCKNPQLRDSLRLFFENSSVRLYAAPSERDMLQFAQRLSDAFACVEVRQPNIVRRCVEFCDRETDCVLSDDTNAIALGAPNVIRDYCGKNVSTTINHIALLNAMGFSRDQFVDFCVLCGTDGIPLIPHIGPERAYRIVSSFNSLEAFIHSEMLDKFLRVPNVHKTLQKRNINLGEFKNSLMDVKSLRNTLIDINV
uniref:XPG-I domain-containing protein n=1 Tax=Babesia bovis TaxID=5865 RepID=S6B989_BABBO|nr:conserved hypothetical protein [Babesia bovis]